MSDLVLKKPHMADTTDPGYMWGSLPTALLGGAALGGGARLIRNLFDLSRDEPTEGAARIKRPKSTVTEIPVEVTPEEAEQLRRRGMKVRKLLSKAAAAKTPAAVPVHQTSPTMLGGLGLGAAATGGGLLGWYLTDLLVDKMRQQAASSDINRVRERISGLLNDRPRDEDEKVYGTMKAAEDAYFSQPAGQQKQAAVGLSDLPWILASLVGGGLTFGALSGYQQARRSSPSATKAQRIKQYLSSRKATTPQLSMVPVLREALREEDEEEEEARQAVPVPEAPAAPVAMPVPVQVVDQPGSPAQQAKDNTASRQPAPNWF